MHIVSREAFALLVAGVIGGAMNAVAGGGSFLVFPAILVAGVPPVAASATTTAGLWIAGLSSLGAYGKRRPRGAIYIALSVASVIGGAAGAKLLLVTSDAFFVRMLPFLLLFAALVFTFGRRLVNLLGGRTLPLALAAVVQIVIAAYGGYFGGGMGIMMLATMSLMGLTDLHEMNALKVLLALLINGVALIGFLLAGKVVVGAAIPVAIGAVLGGWLGAAGAKRVDPAKVRIGVLVFAWLLTAWFFFQAFVGLRK